MRTGQALLLTVVLLLTVCSTAPAWGQRGHGRGSPTSKTSKSDKGRAVKRFVVAEPLDLMLLGCHGELNLQVIGFRGDGLEIVGGRVTLSGASGAVRGEVIAYARSAYHVDANVGLSFSRSQTPVGSPDWKPPSIISILLSQDRRSPKLVTILPVPGAESVTTPTKFRCERVDAAQKTAASNYRATGDATEGPTDLPARTNGQTSTGGQAGTSRSSILSRSHLKLSGSAGGWFGLQALNPAGVLDVGSGALEKEVAGRPKQTYEVFGDKNSQRFLLLFTDPDGMNGEGVYFNLKLSAEPVAVLAMPTLAVMPGLMEILRRIGFNNVVSMVRPFKQSRKSLGRFEESYKTPDAYTSASGAEITVSYESLGRGRGVTTIKIDNLVDPVTGKKTFIEVPIEVNVEEP